MYDDDDDDDGDDDLHSVKKMHFKKAYDFVISSQNFLLIFSYRCCE